MALCKLQNTDKQEQKREEEKNILCFFIENSSLLYWCIQTSTDDCPLLRIIVYKNICVTAFFSKNINIF